jgi:AcrR family transcriptional regulator
MAGSARLTKRAQREASLENLLEAALRLFVSQGYRHTSVEDIAEVAGLTKGAVYFYFRNKEALLVALLERADQAVAAPAVQRISSAGPTAADKLVAFMHGQAKLGIEKTDLVLLLILVSIEFAGTGGTIERLVRAIYGKLYRALETAITLGKRRNEFRMDIRTREQAAIVLALHDGTFLEWYRRRGELGGGELVRALRTSMLAGVKTLQQPGAPARR